MAETGASTSPLFNKLSGELRNKIYRLVLHHDRPIIRSKSRSWEPGLLLACSKSRKEAKAIFYLENRFEFRVTDCDYRPLALWSQKCAALKDGNQEVELVIELIGYLKWSNLKVWLLQARQGVVMGHRVLRERKDDICNHQREAIEEMFLTAEKSKFVGVQHGRYLEHLRYAFAGRAFWGD